VIGRAAAGVIALAVAAGLTAVSPAGACACGIARAAVVLPVPSDPEVQAIAQGDPLAYLDAATAPEPEPSSGDEGAVGSGAALDVLGRDTVGGYDVARLAAEDPRELQRWLDRNGYELPAGAEPILAEPLTLTVYSLADGPRAIDGLQTRWSGSVSELEPAPPPELAQLFAQGDYVTRMQVDAADPASFDEDLAVDDAASGVDEPEGLSGLENANPPGPNDEGAEDDGDELSVVAIALILATAASVLAAAIAYRAHRDD
jgi:hypothetical protein